MSSYDPIPMPPAPDATDGQPCERADLAKWATQGGTLPSRLSAHLVDCAACSAYVRRVTTVHAGLTLLRTQTAPQGLLARANGRALRILRRAARASEAAHRLMRIQPNLTRWQRAQIHAARVSLGVAAAGLGLLFRVGVLEGFERTRDMGETLAAKHWERHIDPDGTFMGPRGLA